MTSFAGPTPSRAGRVAGALSVYRNRFRQGRQYSVPAYALGALLRKRFTTF